MRSAKLSRLSTAPCVALVVALTLAVGACDTDSPTDVQHPTADPATLESAPLTSGGEGVLVSTAFAGLELEPAVGGDGAIIPERWTNLRVMVGGREVESRRLGPERIEFDVPVLPGGTYAVEVTASDATASLSTRVLGVIASARVNDDCFWNSRLTLVPVGDELVFSGECWFDGGGSDWRQGAARVLPASPEAGMKWIPESFFDDEESDSFSRTWMQSGPSIRPGHFVARRPGPDDETPDIWVWRAGADPQPVEPLDCFGGPEEQQEYLFATPAEVAEGVCLTFVPERGVVLRNGAEIAECCQFLIDGTIVLAHDGWSALRGVRDLLVFDPAAQIAYRIEYDTDTIQDVAFSADGQWIYVARNPFNASTSRLEIRDRDTGEVHMEREFEGALFSLERSGDRLWAVRRTGEFSTGRLSVELYDPEDLSLRRAVAVSAELLESSSFASFPGQTPIVQQDATGTRVYVTGWIEDRLGIRSHVVEVF